MSWQGALFNLVIQTAVGGLLLSSVAVAAATLVRQPARRIRIVELALGGLAILPLLALVPGYPRVAILPGGMGETSPDLDSTAGVTNHEIPLAKSEPVAADPLVNAVPAGIAFADPFSQPPAEPDVTWIAAEQPQRFEPELQVAATPTVEPPTEPTAASVEDFSVPSAAAIGQPAGQIAADPLPASPAPVRDVRPWIVAAYGVGVAVMAAWSCLGLAAIGRLMRSAKPADPATRGVLREIAGPDSDRVRLVISARAVQPCAFAWRGPTILLPATLVADGDAQALRWALAHEWSHVERGDIVTWSASSVVRWFYFYQPGLWWLRHQLRLCQDYLADARAASAGAEAADYAEFLTAYASSCSKSPLAVGLGIGSRASELHRRVVMLVHNRRPLETVSPRRWNVVVFSLALAVLAAVACVRPEPAAAEPQSAEKPATNEDAKPGQPDAGDVFEAPSASNAEAPSISKGFDPFAQDATVPQRTEEPAVGPQPDTEQPKPSITPPSVKPDAAGAPVKAEPPRREGFEFNRGSAAPNARRVAAGDVLSLDVMSNLDEAAGVRLLLRPNFNANVESDGTLSLGGHYSSLKVAGMDLREVEHKLQDVLRHQVENDIRARIQSLKKAPVKESQIPRLEVQINVRASFVNPVANPPITMVTTAPGQAAAPQISPVPLGLVPGPTLTPPAPYSPTPANTILPPPAGPARVKAGDVLHIETVDGLKAARLVPTMVVVEPDGNIAIGPRFGRVNVLARTLVEVEEAIKKVVANEFENPEIQVTFTRRDLTANDGDLATDDAHVRELERELEQLKRELRKAKSTPTTPARQ